MAVGVPAVVIEFDSLYDMEQLLRIRRLGVRIPRARQFFNNLTGMAFSALARGKHMGSTRTEVAAQLLA